MVDVSLGRIIKKFESTVGVLSISRKGNIERTIKDSSTEIL